MVMRVYTAKPRTNGDGYKGLIHQPNTAEAPSLINGIKAVRVSSTIVSSRKQV